MAKRTVAKRFQQQKVSSGGGGEEKVIEENGVEQQSHQTSSDWVEMTNHSGRVYYANEKTSETSWEKPAGIKAKLRRIEKVDELQKKLIQRQARKEKQQDDNDVDQNMLDSEHGIDVASTRGVWIEVHDEESGLTAYFNQHTQKIQLIRPKGWVRMLSQEINKTQIAQLTNKKMKKIHKRGRRGSSSARHYTKHLDIVSGRYYYIDNENPMETTWTAPEGVEIRDA